MLTLEQIIEAARALLPPDRQRLQQWLQEQAQLDAVAQPRPAPPPRQETPPQQMAHFRQAMNWIDEHRAAYLGQWVVLRGDQLISAAPDAKTAYEKAKAAGIETPFLHHVIDEPEAFYAGWS